jgi:hypothetical protein
LKTEIVLAKRTAEAFCKFLPIISTREPSGPLVGEMRAITGESDWAARTGRAEISKT